MTLIVDSPLGRPDLIAPLPAQYQMDPAALEATQELCSRSLFRRRLPSAESISSQAIPPSSEALSCRFAGLTARLACSAHGCRARCRLQYTMKPWV